MLLWYTKLSLSSLIKIDKKNDDDGDGGDAYDDEKDEGGYEWEEHKLSFD